MVFNKKGQGLSLNVIIIAALALIVLVVLAVIFTSRAGVTERQLEDVSGPTKLKLTTLKITYGDCHPSASRELTFATDFDAKELPDDKAKVESDMKADIANCKALAQCNCDDPGYCAWK